MSPGLRLRGLDVFKPLKRNISTREAAVSVHCPLGVWPRAATLQHGEQKLAASPVSGPEEPLPAMAPCSPLLRPLDTRGRHLVSASLGGGSHTGAWRSAPAALEARLCTTSSGVPCHPIAQRLRLQAAGPWESTPSQEAALPSE